MNQKRIWCVGLMAVILWVGMLYSAAYAACTVSTTSINFGNYDFLSPSPAFGTGTISLSCTRKSTVSISIGASSNSGSFSPRTMKIAGLGDALDYNLYTSAAMVQVWGDGTNGTVTVDVTNVRKNNIPPISIYGKIIPLQNVTAGNYRERLVVTITY